MPFVAVTPVAELKDESASGGEFGKKLGSAAGAAAQCGVARRRERGGEGNNVNVHTDRGESCSERAVCEQHSGDLESARRAGPREKHLLRPADCANGVDEADTHQPTRKARYASAITRACSTQV